MKVVALVGSPKKSKSMTAALLQFVLEGARQEGATDETVFLPGGTVRPCMACDACHVKGACPQKDEFTTIRGKIEASDALILASPNYINSVSAQLKAFLDRCCGVVHLLGFTGKYGATVVTSGGGPEEPIARYLESFLVTTGAVPVGSVWATMGGKTTFDEKVKVDARALGKRLVSACAGKERLPEVERQQEAFRERMKWLMEDRKDLWRYEYEYWQKRYGL